MGNLVSVDVEGLYNKLCEDLLSNDPQRNKSGCLHWATPTMKAEQLTHFIECLGKNTTLQRLVLQDMDSLPAESHPLLAKAVQEHPALTCLGFHGRLPKQDFMNVYADTFGKSATLTEFEIENSIIPTPAVDSLIAILQQQQSASSSTTKLTSLQVKGCQVSAEELGRLAKTLKESATASSSPTVSSTMQVLEITLKPPVPAVEAAKDLADFLQAPDSALHTVSLSGILGDGAISTMMGGLQKGPGRLQRLTVQGKGVDDDQAMESIGALFLVENSSLAILDVSDSTISSSSGVHLAKALQQSFSKGNEGAPLRELYLSHNSLGDTGTVELAKAIEQPESYTKNLKVLDMRLNQIGTKGVVALSKAIQMDHVTNLEKLCLGEEAIRGSRRFETEDANALGEMIQKNTSLKHLHLKDASFHDEALEKVLPALAQNTTLKKLHIACFTTASLQKIITTLPQLHLETICISACGETQLDEATEKSLLDNLAQNKSLVEFNMDSFKGRSELTWKSLKLKVDSLLSDRTKDETGATTSSTKRALNTDGNGVEETAKRSKSD